jgi:actin-related protein
VYSVWRGSSILSGLPQFQQQWFSRFAYDEAGGYRDNNAAS